MIDKEELVRQVTQIVISRLNYDLPLEVLETIVTEVVKGVMEELVPSEKSGKEKVIPFIAEGMPPLAYCSQCIEAFKRRETTEKAVITVTGMNSPGIVAAISGAIAEMKGDILDISQTLVGDYFTMIMVVDISKSKESGVSFDQFKDSLIGKGKELNLHVTVLHEMLFNAMQRV